MLYERKVKVVIKYFSFLFIVFFFFSSLKSVEENDLEVCVFDCGQGNTVAARLGQKTMIFDAGSKARSKFAYYEDEHGDESTGEGEFEIQTPDKIQPLWITLKDDHVKLKASKDSKEEKENFLKVFTEYVFGGTEEKRSLIGIFISHPDVDHYNIIRGRI